MKKESKSEKFLRVRAEVRAEKLKNYSAYEGLRRERNWPSRPEIEFENYGWLGWENFLLFEVKLEKFLRITKEVKLKGISNYSMYEKYRAQYTWPSRPEREFFSYGWSGWSNFLGQTLKLRKKSAKKERRVSFDDLKKQVSFLGIGSFFAYKEAVAHHDDWPTYPKAAYKEFVNWDDFFGVNHSILSLIDLRKEVQSLGLSSQEIYRKTRKLECKKNWPTNPVRHYVDWVSWSDLFGVKIIEKIKRENFISYIDLRAQLIIHGISSYDEYRKKRIINDGWPSNPYVHYKVTGEWISYADLFGGKSRIRQ
ncbi:MAG: hypothetical protein NT165_02065 [Candidatus Falkowbacteria bacterium]|nr:hypothetical protein [Candidatus Falkowbacteria bacterium]